MDEICVHGVDLLHFAVAEAVLRDIWRILLLNGGTMDTNDNPAFGEDISMHTDWIVPFKGQPKTVVAALRFGYRDDID